jgi:drug/metabolite transporter (DMT)-like permease
MVWTAILFWPSESVARSQVVGMIVALVSVVAAAVNLVSVKKYGKELDVFVMNALGMTIGAVLLLTMSAVSERGAVVTWTAANVGAIIYLALAGSVTAFLSYYSLVKVMDATRLSLITLIFPLVAVVLGWAVLREAFPPGARAGMAAVVLGVAIAIVPAPRRG